MGSFSSLLAATAEDTESWLLVEPGGVVHPAPEVWELEEITACQL